MKIEQNESRNAGREKKVRKINVARCVLSFIECDNSPLNVEDRTKGSRRKRITGFTRYIYIVYVCYFEKIRVILRDALELKIRDFIVITCLCRYYYIIYVSSSGYVVIK